MMLLLDYVQVELFTYLVFAILGSPAHTMRNRALMKGSTFFVLPW